MRVLSSGDVLIIVRKIETTDGIKPNSDPRINDIHIPVIIFPKYAGWYMI